MERKVTKRYNRHEIITYSPVDKNADTEVSWGHSGDIIQLYHQESGSYFNIDKNELLALAAVFQNLHEDIRQVELLTKEPSDER